MRLSRISAIALCFALLLTSRAGAEKARLTVLHTTDLHGRLIGTDLLEQRPVSGGLARIATLVRGIRASGPVLLLDAGDAMQGDAIETVYRMGEDPTLPDPVMSAMRAIGYDAMAPGNHDFDYGLDALARARVESGFPWIAANVVSTGADGPRFAPSMIKTIGGLRVGVVGLCTPAVAAWSDSSLWRGLRFEDPVDAARREVRRLREQKRCDVVLLLAHTGLAADSAGTPRPGQRSDENWGERLANDVPGVDLVILGHTHDVIPGRRISGTPVTQAGRSGEWLGRVDFTLTREHGGMSWRVSDVRSQLVAAGDSVAADSSVTALAAPYVDGARRVLDRAIARAEHAVDAPDGRLADGPLWELLHTVQLQASGADVSLTPLFRPDAGWPAGPVTLRDVIRAYPYENRLVVMELTGAELKAALEHAATYFRRYAFKAGASLIDSSLAGYNFDTAEGVSYEIDLTRPPGDRVVRLRFHDEPMDSASRVKVAMSDYRAGGGGGYDMLATHPMIWRSPTTLRDLLIEYVQRVHAIPGEHAPNWRLLPDYVTAPARPLIDRLVRLSHIPPDEVLRLGAFEPARRGDLAYWLARAFDWKATRRSGAFGDVSPTLEPWVDALLRRRVMGTTAQADHFKPFDPASVWLTLDWCENAAKAARYALSPKRGDSSYRRGLLTGTGWSLAEDRSETDGRRFTRADLLGVIANVRYPELRILSTSDFHGNFFPSRERSSGRDYGGTVALAAHLERLRAANPEGTVLLDGGDCFQGTMLSNLQFGRPVVEQMNLLDYTATAIGNHEFDWGVDTLKARVREMHFPALGANFHEKKSGRLPAWVRADTLVRRRGVRIGVLGLCYRNTPTVTLAANVAPYRFEDDSVSAARAVPRLRAKDHAEVVVAVGHVPAESNRERKAREGDLVRLARGVPGVDAWFGGHSHNFVDDAIGGVPVMIPGAFGRAVAVVDLVVDPIAGRVVERHQYLDIAYTDDFPPDSAWIARLDHWNADVAPIAETPLGRVAHALDRNGPETTIGNLITDAMREASGVDIALQNSGGMRANLDAGVVTRGEVYAIMPFDNTIVVEELTGAEVKRALDEALTRGRVTQVSGIRYTYDPDRPEMERVTDVMDASGQPLDEARTYRVACNNFMATGGDDYATLTRGRHLTDTNQLIRAAIETYILKYSSGGRMLDVQTDGRIRRVRVEAPAEVR